MTADGALLAHDGPALLAAVAADRDPEAWLAALLPLASAASDTPAPALAVRRQGQPSEAALAVLPQLRQVMPRTGPATPVSDDLGLALHLICRARRSQRVLELGTGGGALAIWLASAMAATGGRLLSIERDSATRTRAAAHLRRAGLDAHARLDLGDTARLLWRLEGPADLVVMDHTYEERTDDLDRVLPILGRGSVLASTDSLSAAHELSRLNALLRTRPEFTVAVNLAVGSGLTLARVR